MSPGFAVAVNVFTELSSAVKTPGPNPELLSV